MNPSQTATSLLPSDDDATDEHAPAQFPDEIDHFVQFTPAIGTHVPVPSLN
jgi:hypothetical protein